jgi:hypothetical protein
MKKHPWKSQDFGLFTPKDFSNLNKFFLFFVEIKGVLKSIDGSTV